MTSRAFLFSFLIVLIGCKPNGHWSNALETHACAEEETAKAQGEAKWCMDNTDYLDSYCYSTAIIRNCKPLATPSEERKP